MVVFTLGDEVDAAVMRRRQSTLVNSGQDRHHEAVRATNNSVRRIVRSNFSTCFILEYSVHYNETPKNYQSAKHYLF